MPLNIGVEHKAVISILRNFNTFKKVLKLVDKKYFLKGEGVFESEETVADSLRIIYPNDYDLENEDAAQLVVQRYKNDILEVYDDISKKFFVIDNGKIFLKQEKLSDYNLYSTLLDTYPFFAYFLLQQCSSLSKTSLKLGYLDSYIDETFRFYGNIENHISQVTDPHIHMGAALDFHYRINNILSKPEEQDFSKLPNELFLHLHPAIKTNIFFYLFSLLETILIYYILFRDKIFLKDLQKVLKWLIKCCEQANHHYDLENDIHEIMLKYSSIRHGKLHKTPHPPIDDPLLEGLINKAMGYFSQNSSIHELKIGDKTLVIFFIQVLKSHGFSKNTLITNSIRIYLMMRNITKVIIVQQHRRSGFGYFESYSSSSFKKGIVKPSEILNSILHPRINTNIEARTTLGNTVEDIQKKIIKNIRALKSINKRTGKKHKLKFIYHFLKIRDKEEELLERSLDKETNTLLVNGIPPKYHNPRKIFKSQASTLNQFLTMSEYRFFSFTSDQEYEKECTENSNLFKKNKKQKEHYEDLFKKYVQGIDAANKEYHIPPEAFSGVYAFFKQSISSSGLALSHNFNKKTTELNLQYTFHVGEEFRDICSGLRAIFEAVTFLNLKDEDRIGHGIALGITPSVLLNERKQITLTQGEYFDNLIFMYYIFSQVSEPPQSLGVLKNRINRIASSIYNSEMLDEYCFSVDDYIDAWLLRRNCPNEMIRMYKRLLDNKEEFQADIFSPELALNLKRMSARDKINHACFELDSYDKIFIQAALPDFFDHIDEKAQPEKRYLTAASNLNAFKILGLYNCDPTVRKKQNDIYRGNVIFEEDVYEFLQDFMMEEVIAKKNIYVEVLPTSNVLITSIGTYENHPFIRLNPPKEITPNRFGLRKSKVKILVGTDDPGIQGTNIMMELYHIKYLVAQKYGKEIAEKYVLKIIEQGNYIFNK